MGTHKNSNMPVYKTMAQADLAEHQGKDNTVRNTAIAAAAAAAAADAKKGHTVLNKSKRKHSLKRSRKHNHKSGRKHGRKLFKK